jgi:hypothetical protein
MRHCAVMYLTCLSVYRKIAAAQIVKEGGAEMLDAAAAYQQS